MNRRKFLEAGRQSWGRSGGHGVLSGTGECSHGERGSAWPKRGTHLWKKWTRKIRRGTVGPDLSCLIGWRVAAGYRSRECRSFKTMVRRSRVRR